MYQTISHHNTWPGNAQHDFSCLEEMYHESLHIAVYFYWRHHLHYDRLSGLTLHLIQYLTKSFARSRAGCHWIVPTGHWKCWIPCTWNDSAGPKRADRCGLLAKTKDSHDAKRSTTDVTLQTTFQEIPAKIVFEARVAVWLDANTHWQNSRKAENQASIKSTTLQTLHLRQSLASASKKCFLAVCNMEVNCTICKPPMRFQSQGGLSRPRQIKAIYLLRKTYTVYLLSCAFGTQR